jgi:acyl carrier protein
MEDKFIRLFKETLEIEDQDINLSTNFRQLKNWDSLSFLSVLAMLDEEYNVVIEGNDFKKLNTIEDLVKVIKSKTE